MLKTQPKVSAWLVATAVALAVQTALAVEVKVGFDKAFDFKAVHTWGWKPDGPGKVIMPARPTMTRKPCRSASTRS
jgi:phage gpG-like protein